MSEETYRKYIELGPDALQMAQTMAALEFRDENPAEARRVEARVEREQREAADKDDLHHAWLRQGGDERDFESAHRELSSREKTERLAAMDLEAREASRRRIAQGF
jgi:hypothetical protein